MILPKIIYPQNQETMLLHVQNTKKKMTKTPIFALPRTL